MPFAPGCGCHSSHAICSTCSWLRDTSGVGAKLKYIGTELLGLLLRGLLSLNTTASIETPHLQIPLFARPTDHSPGPTDHSLHHGPACALDIHLGRDLCGALHPRAKGQIISTCHVSVSVCNPLVFEVFNLQRGTTPWMQLVVQRRGLRSMADITYLKSFCGVEQTCPTLELRLCDQTWFLKYFYLGWR